MLLEQLDSHCKYMNFYPYLVPYMKINSRWTMYLNVKYKTGKNYL